MKKVLSFIMILAILFCSVSPVLAADEYSFDLQYTGNLVKNVEKDAVVLLTGVGGTLHTRSCYTKDTCNRYDRSRA